MSADEGKIASHSRTIVTLLRLVHDLRGDRAAISELLNVALELNHDMARAVAASRTRYLWLLAQHRSLLSGRTNAEERQALEDEPQTDERECNRGELERAA